MSGITKSQLITDLEASFAEVTQWVQTQAIEDFVKSPEGKWNTAQHIDHLTQTAKAINRGMLVPKFYLKYKFGAANRPPRSSDEIISKYQNKLKTIPENFVNPMMPGTYTTADKVQLIKGLNREGSNLSKRVSKWSDQQLDKYVLPHPLVGRMLIREFIVWATYHNRHHLRILEISRGE